MSGNRTPFGAELEMPEPAPLRVHAMFDRDRPCLDHQVAYTGRIPCTGLLRCFLCGTEWHEDGRLASQQTTRERTP